MNTTNYKLELTADEIKAVHTALQYSKTNPYNPVQTERAIYSASAKIEAAQHPKEAEKPQDHGSKKFRVAKLTRIIPGTGHKEVEYLVLSRLYGITLATFCGSGDERWPMTILEAEQAAEDFWKEMEGRKAQ